MIILLSINGIFWLLFLLHLKPRPAYRLAHYSILRTAGLIPVFYFTSFVFMSVRVLTVLRIRTRGYFARFILHSAIALNHVVLYVVYLALVYNV